MIKDEITTLPLVARNDRCQNEIATSVKKCDGLAMTSPFSSLRTVGEAISCWQGIGEAPNYLM
ncbi:hypothetical protein KAX35_05340 [candidate division WOR-3 bacterium]|nr:hypothetical protein [candidate division WOR-3 bacterium]